MAQFLPHLRHKEKHNVFEQSLMYFYSFFFIAIDVFYNYTFGTLFFWQLPDWKHKTLSERLRKILAEEPEESKRWKLAYWVCRYFISPWDFNHCRAGLGG